MWWRAFVRQRRAHGTLTLDSAHRIGHATRDKLNTNPPRAVSRRPRVRWGPDVSAAAGLQVQPPRCGSRTMTAGSQISENDISGCIC